MDRYPRLSKWLVVGIILLFIGVTIAPTLNLTVAKTSSDNDVVEVTAQACGITGYDDTTVKLTRQQYQNLEQYLVDVRARLNYTSARGDAVLIFKEAVVELNKYGVLPTGMSVEQAQKLVIDGYSKEHGPQIVDKMAHENRLQDNQNNCCCLVLGVVQDGYATGIVGMIGMILQILAMGVPLLLLIVIGYMLLLISEIIVTIVPFSLMQSITLFSANIISLGLLGFKHHTIPPNSGTGKIFGFNGIKLTNIKTGEMKFLGFALVVLDLSHD